MKLLIALFIFLSTISVYPQNEDSTASHKDFFKDYLFSLFKYTRFNFQANVLQSFIVSDSTIKRELFKDNSFSAGLEWGWKYKEKLNYGLGLMYEFPSTIRAFDGNLGGFPIYVFLEYPIVNNDAFPIYLSCRFGADILSTESQVSGVRDGIYHSIGLNFGISKVTNFKIQYSNNYGRIKVGKKEYDFNNGNLNFIIGIEP